MTLEILISTIDAGINNIAAMLLEPRDGIKYLVSWQHRAEGDCVVPDVLLRDDVKVVHLQGPGLSRNRNNCLKHATGDVCLIADDDCRYTHEELSCIALTFASHRNVDVATFKARGLLTPYPDKSFDLQVPPKDYHVSSIEIAFRRVSVQGKLRFNELFGLGAPVLHCAEEEVFIHDALNMGLKCVYFPAYVVSHESPSTSVSRIDDPGTLMARGAYLYIAYRQSMIPRAALISYRLSRTGKVSMLKALKYILKGIAYCKREISRDN